LESLIFKSIINNEKTKEESPNQSPDTSFALSKFWKSPIHHQKGIFNAEMTKTAVEKTKR
jgi:hypothetical protein